MSGWPRPRAIAATFSYCCCGCRPQAGPAPCEPCCRAVLVLHQRNRVGVRLSDRGPLSPYQYHRDRFADGARMWGFDRCIEVEVGIPTGMRAQQLQRAVSESGRVAALARRWTRWDQVGWLRLDGGGDRGEDTAAGRLPAEQLPVRSCMDCCTCGTNVVLEQPCKACKGSPPGAALQGLQGKPSWAWRCWCVDTQGACDHGVHMYSSQMLHRTSMGGEVRIWGYAGYARAWTLEGAWCKLGAWGALRALGALRADRLEGAPTGQTAAKGIKLL